MLRVTKDRKLKYVSLGISVNPEHWDFSKNIPKLECCIFMPFPRVDT